MYLCNEAISDMQAWVNGSLRSADLALAHFKIKPLPNEKVTARGLETASEPQRRQGFGGNGKGLTFQAVWYTTAL